MNSTDPGGARCPKSSASPRARFLRAVSLRIISLVVPALLAGCATTGDWRPEPNSEDARCLAFFQRLDTAVRDAGVGDAQSRVVPGFPWLRTDRFLSSYARESLDASQFRQWVELMARLGEAARPVELNRLPERALRQVDGSAGESSPETLLAKSGECSRRLTAELPQSLAGERLSHVAVKSSSYHRLRKVVGLYPVVALPLLWGIGRYHEEVLESYSRPLSELAVAGRLVRFVPDAPDALAVDEVAAIVRRASRNPLGIPLPSATDRERLFATFAPSLEMDVDSRDDRIGKPFWKAPGIPDVGVDEPTLYTQVSHARLDGKVLLQLNYVAWFPARPRKGRLDMLGGRLDSIIWRVTLGADGVPILFDSVHSCGCYHKFYPTEQLALRRERIGFEEPILVPQRLDSTSARHLLRVSSGDHYIERVLPAREDGGASVRYRLADYGELRALAANGGQTSLFAANGIVRGTQRLERIFLWPTGIISAGAMRQWGGQAVAFVGERHFDAPDLIARYFETRGDDAVE